MPLKDQHRQEFYDCIRDLIHTPQVQSMGQIAQHTGEVSRLEHSLYVSYVGFLLCDFFGLDQRAAARGGLLHDMHYATRDEAFSFRARLLPKGTGHHRQAHVAADGFPPPLCRILPRLPGG